MYLGDGLVHPLALKPVLIPLFFVVLLKSVSEAPSKEGTLVHLCALARVDHPASHSALVGDDHFQPPVFVADHPARIVAALLDVDPDRPDADLAFAIKALPYEYKFKHFRLSHPAVCVDSFPPVPALLDDRHVLRVGASAHQSAVHPQAVVVLFDLSFYPLTVVAGRRMQLPNA